MKTAFIAGTGLTVFENLLTNIQKHENTENQYGKIIVYYTGEYKGNEIVVLPRHGSKEKFRSPADLVKEKGHEAHIWLLHELGVDQIFASSAVGVLNPEFDLIDKNNFILPKNYIRGFGASQHSFGNFAKTVHANMSFPFNLELREKAKKAIEETSCTCIDKGIYIYNGGDQFETTEEIRILNNLIEEKPKLAGMTAVPEVILAAQMHIPYVVICCPTNYAEGIEGKRVHHDEHIELMKKMQGELEKLFTSILHHL
tara:strand:- start:8370 stop:9137 length:768 start_codon:yes stop_codon:yes gene_type:complete